jgi:16S rRNA (guanine(1405)-N(7))-methyltransferase
MSDLDAVVAAVARSKKYRTVCEDTIRRIGERELARRGGVRAATKATKRQLHQVYGAFEEAINYVDVYQRLAAAYGAGSQVEVKAGCRWALSLHSSTRERLPILDQFYEGVFSVTGEPASVLDLGCGLNPLALPWMALGTNARYVALDIDAERVRFLNRYLALAGLEPAARYQDLLARPPEDAVDVALLLKMSPSLERQEPGATLRLLAQLSSPWIVVSFAVKSLGGREKGMLDHYGQRFPQSIREAFPEGTWRITELGFETELVFVLGRSANKAHG